MLQSTYRWISLGFALLALFFLLVSAVDAYSGDVLRDGVEVYRVQALFYLCTVVFAGLAAAFGWVYQGDVNRRAR